MSHALLWIQGKMVHEHLLLVTSAIVVWQMMFLVWQTVSGLICSTGFSSTINSISTLVWYLSIYFLCKHLLLFSYKTLSKLSSGWPQKVYIINTPCPWNRSRFHQNVPKAKLFWDNFVSHVPIFVTFHFCDQECFADKSIDFFLPHTKNCENKLAFEFTTFRFYSKTLLQFLTRDSLHNGRITIAVVVHYYHRFMAIIQYPQ